MNNLRGMLGIRRMVKVLNAWIRQLYGVMKGVDEKSDEGFQMVHPFGEDGE